MESFIDLADIAKGLMSDNQQPTLKQKIINITDLSKFLCLQFFFYYIENLWMLSVNFRSSRSELFLGKGVLKICSQFTGEHRCRSASSHFEVGVTLTVIVNILRTPFPISTSGWLLPKFAITPLVKASDTRLVIKSISFVKFGFHVCHLKTSKQKLSCFELLHF